MNTAPITIEKGRVSIRQIAGGIWLTKHQIADLFGVFVSAVGSNIRSILGNSIFQERNVCRYRDNGNGNFVEVYNLEMITALAFRLKSDRAEHFRRWIMERAVNPVLIWKIPGMEALLN